MNLKRNWKPYRIVVCALGFQRGRQTVKACKIKPCTMGWLAWNPDDFIDPGRLLGSGTFIWPGLHAAYRAAMLQFRLPAVHQVQIRTNQDRILYIWNRHADRTITGYNSAE